MSQSVDRTGQRTLAVVTKADKSPEGLLEKIAADDVNIGLGYVCVRNRIGEESYEEARAEEVKLFSSNSFLCGIDKSIVGIPALAERLTAIQANIIVKCLPEIVRKIDEKLAANLEELNKMPKHLSSIGEAMTALMNMIASATESLRKILLQGEFDDDMHAASRLAEMLNKFSDDLRSVKTKSGSDDTFLAEEMRVLKESRLMAGLSNFIPVSAFHALLAKKVNAVSPAPFACAEKIWSYIQSVTIAVLLKHCGNYPQLVSSTRRAAVNLITRRKDESAGWIKDLVEMEKLTEYTCNPEYTALWTKLMAEQAGFVQRIRGNSLLATLSKFGEINIAHLWGLDTEVVHEAYDLKMRMAAYWDVVTKRMVDNMVLHLHFSIQKLVKKEMQKEIIDELMGPQGNGLQRMMEEPPSVSEKRKKLHSSISLLQQSKDIVANIMDKISVD